MTAGGVTAWSSFYCFFYPVTDRAKRKPENGQEDKPGEIV